MKLDQYLKWKGWVFTGGEAKQRIQGGDVRVNGAVETVVAGNWWREIALCLPARSPLLRGNPRPRRKLARRSVKD